MKILKDFVEKLVSNQKDLEPEYAKVVNDHFWELVEKKDLKVEEVKKDLKVEEVKKDLNVEEVKNDEEIDDFWL